MCCHSDHGHRNVREVICGIDPWSGQAGNNIKLVFAPLKHAALSSKNKDWLAQNQDA